MNSYMDAAKANLRQRMLAARAALTAEEVAARSHRAQERLASLACFDQAATLLLYRAFRGEVETAGLTRLALDRGKVVVLPRVQQRPRRLDLHRFGGDEGELITGSYGIPEPDPASPRIDPALVDLAVVPGLAFDRQGGRLGYGGGFFDRLLPSLGPQAVILGLAYEFQRVQAVPAGPRDMRVHGVVTDSGVFWVAAGSA